VGGDAVEEPAAVAESPATQPGKIEEPSSSARSVSDVEIVGRLRRGGSCWRRLSASLPCTRLRSARKSCAETFFCWSPPLKVEERDIGGLGILRRPRSISSGAAGDSCQTLFLRPSACAALST